MRTAPGRVDHDLRIAPGERVDVEARQLARAFAVAGVRMQRTAADLLFRHAHPQAVAFEQSHGRTLGLPEGLTHDAAGEDACLRVGSLRTPERRALPRRREGRRPPETTR